MNQVADIARSMVVMSKDLDALKQRAERQGQVLLLAVEIIANLLAWEAENRNAIEKLPSRVQLELDGLITHCRNLAHRIRADDTYRNSKEDVH